MYNVQNKIEKVGTMSNIKKVGWLRIPKMCIIFSENIFLRFYLPYLSMQTRIQKMVTSKSKIKLGRASLEDTTVK
jgi:hypothetical protein